VESHRRSAKHQRNSFREAESKQTFLKDLCTRFCRQAIFVSFQQNKDFYPIGLIFNTLYEYALYSAFQLQAQEIDRSK